MKLRNILLSAIAISAVATAASAQVSATGTATTDAQIVQPLTIASTGSLNFGTMTRPTSASVVNLTTANARTVSSGNTALVGTTSAVPTFTVSGEGSATYTLTAADFDLTGPGGATVGVSPDLSLSSGTLSNAGSQTFTVGGDLSLAANQAVGAYTGELSVTVAYN